jgi:CheY-like chemotaxis protein
LPGEYALLQISNLTCLHLCRPSSNRNWNVRLFEAEQQRKVSDAKEVLPILILSDSKHTRDDRLELLVRAKALRPDVPVIMIRATAMRTRSEGGGAEARTKSTEQSK